MREPASQRSSLGSGADSIAGSVRSLLSLIKSRAGGGLLCWEPSPAVVANERGALSFSCSIPVTNMAANRKSSLPERRKIVEGKSQARVASGHRHAEPPGKNSVSKVPGVPTLNSSDLW